MPSLDGLKLTRQIREDVARAMPGDRERCLDAGANDCLSKPTSAAKLACAIAPHLVLKDP